VGERDHEGCVGWRALAGVNLGSTRNVGLVDRRWIDIDRAQRFGDRLVVLGPGYKGRSLV
jgi:hypothetical protein